MHFYTDSKFVHDHWVTNTSDTMANQPLWKLFWQLASSNRYRVAINKVAAHKTLEDVAEGTISLEDYLGNDMADKAAKQAATERALPRYMSHRLKHNLHKIKAIQRRLVEINMHCLQWPLPKKTRKTKVTRRTQAERLRDLIEASDHPNLSFDPVRRRWSCTNCGLCLATGPLYTLLRRSTECRDPLLNQVYEDHRRDHPAPLFHRAPRRTLARTLTLHDRTSHPSHALLFYRGVYYCNRCGCVATTELHSLADECRPRRPNGAANLARLRSKPPKPPYHVQRALGGWPNPDNSAVPLTYTIPILTKRTIPKMVTDPAKVPSRYDEV